MPERPTVEVAQQLLTRGASGSSDESPDAEAYLRYAPLLLALQLSLAQAVRPNPSGLSGLCPVLSGRSHAWPCRAFRSSICAVDPSTRTLCPHEDGCSAAPV